jgi:hypothetical protein
MRSSLAAKPATALSSEPAPEIVGSGGRNNQTISETPTAPQGHAVTLASIDAFDYSAVEPAAVPSLRASAKTIRARITKTTADIIATGRELALAKAHLDHGQFCTWVEAEIGISARTAQRYMAATELADKNDTVSLLPPTMVHRLAAKSAPEEVVDEVIARARSGEIISDRAVVDMIGEVKHRQREAARRDEEARRRRAMPKRRREAEERDRQAVLQYTKDRQDAILAAAKSLLERFTADDIAFIVEMFERGDDVYGVLDGLKRRTAVSA